MGSNKVGGKMYDKVGWLNNPVLNEEGCGRTGEQKVGWLNNPV